MEEHLSREEELRENNNSHIDGVLKEANTGLAVYEIQSEKPLALKLRMASKGFLSITGFDENDLLEENHDVFNALYNNSSDEVITSLISGDNSQDEVRLQMRRKCGEVRKVQTVTQKVLCHCGLFLVKSITDLSVVEETHQKIISKNQVLVEENERLIRQGDAAVNVIESMAEERKKNQARIYTSIVQLLEPAIHNLKLNNFSKKEMVVLLESITLSLSGLGSEKIQSALKVLSAKELEMAHLIRQGYSSKEIASFMNVGHQTVSSYRKNVRKKLGIQNASVNLKEYLVELFDNNDSAQG
jgi:DNA-binding CsgD family transcriptional regulator